MLLFWALLIVGIVVLIRFTADGTTRRGGAAHRLTSARSYLRAHLGRRTPLDLAVHGDVGATQRAVLPLVGQKSDRSFLDRVLREHARALEEVVSAYTHDVERHTPIHPEYAAHILDEVAAGDAIFTVDTGMCNVRAARYITPNGRRRVIGSFRHGTMANALPHAIGAQFAHPGRQVISMSGDGGLGMLLQAGDARRRHSRLAELAMADHSRDPTDSH